MSGTQPKQSYNSFFDSGLEIIQVECAYHFFRCVRALTCHVHNLVIEPHVDSMDTQGVILHTLTDHDVHIDMWLWICFTRAQHARDRKQSWILEIQHLIHLKQTLPYVAVTLWDKESEHTVNGPLSSQHLAVHNDDLIGIFRKTC